MTALIEIAVDGGPGYGFGHISRSKTLAAALREAGARVRFDPRSPVAREALKGEADMAGEADVLVLDLPYADDAAVRAARSAGRPVAVLDPVGQARADLAIRTDPRPVPMAADRCEYGLSYAMIRREILDQAPREDGHVLVCVGGSDLGDLGLEAARRLALAGERVVLVRGPLAAPLASAPPGVDLRLSPPDLPALMAGCRFAVTNAGTTALEAMALGKPVHVLAQTEAEHATGVRFLQDSLILGLGLETLAPPDPEHAARVAATGAAQVDGRGGERVARLILGLLDQARATP